MINFRCIPLRGGNLALLHHRCLDYLPNEKCYIYDYGLNFDRTITLLTILDSSVESSTTTPACLEVVRAYTCNYIYPKCDPATGNYQGVCTDDCIKYVLSDNCRAIFDTLAAISETSGAITFTRQCDNTLINLEQYIPGFPYNPEDCFNISGELYVYNSSPGYCYSINIASRILLHSTIHTIYSHYRSVIPLLFYYLHPGLLENITFSQRTEPPTIPETTNATSDIAIILPSVGATTLVLLILAAAVLLICIYNRRKKRNAMQHSL